MHACNSYTVWLAYIWSYHSVFQKYCEIQMEISYNELPIGLQWFNIDMIYFTFTQLHFLP